MTTYVVLLPADEAGWESASEEQRAHAYGEHAEFAEALAARGHRITGGAELAHSREARVVREAGITEGPYAESVEQLTGFYLVDSDDLDDLLDVCGILARRGGAVEVRASVGGTD